VIRPAPRPLTRRALLSAAGGWLVAAGTAWPALAAAQGAPAPAELASDLPGARLQGEGLMRFLGFRVYEIRLWTAERPVAAEWATVPLALELIYARKLVGEQIAERSLDEMRRQRDIADADAQRWLGAMKQLFPDVAKGDRLTGLLLPGRGARFFLNGKLRGEVAEPEFARLFFGIWLSPRTSEPALRETLLGGAR
jgi:hypothetical protein